VIPVNGDRAADHYPDEPRRSCKTPAVGASYNPGVVSHVSRRTFMSAIAMAAPVLAMPAPVAAASNVARSLRFAHLHTGERLAVEYLRGGVYVPDALAAIDHVLRDFRTGEVHRIDTDLLDLLSRLGDLTGTRAHFEVISGYRSPATNDMLRQRSEGVAAGSLHMQGKAIDIRLADVPLVALRRAALSTRRGGVGYYRASNFVHVDTGRVRSW
jgi:uncharacterized protein YcbK (DUF882 family)